MIGLEGACSRYVGIVTEVDELLAAPDDSRLTHVFAVGAEGDERFEAGGTGYAASPTTARSAALGEAIERYAAARPPDSLPLASADELDAAVEPERFALFAPEQYGSAGFPFVPFTKQTAVRWVTGWSLADGRSVLLPAQLVYLVWDELADGEAAIAHATSSGLACGTSTAEAALAGLLELVERDAFMLVWRNALSLPLLDASAAPELVAWERRYLDPARLRHDVVDLSDIHRVPAAIAVVHDVGGSLGVGAAANPEPAVAYRKALAEAYASHGAARRIRDAGAAGGFRDDFADVVTFADHIRVYADPDNAPRAAFLTASPVRRALTTVAPLPGSTVDEQLASLVGRLLQAGIEPYMVDVTTPDVAELGLHVVRTIAPELCMLDVRQDACFLGGSRLRAAPVELGLRTRELPLSELNHSPHPFP